MGDDTPRIYVASLSDYNAGRLHGAWIECDQTADEIQSQVQLMLAASVEPNAEEWAIHDFENFGALKVGEWESFETVAEWAAGIAEHGEAFAAYLTHDGDPDTFGEAFQGSYESREDFAQSLADDIGAVPDDLTWPCSYINWEAAARDLFLSGDYFDVTAPDYSLWVFRGDV